MKTIVSLAIALTAIPVGTLAATSAAIPLPPSAPELVAAVLPDQPPSPDESQIRARIAHLGSRARAHSRRLGLTAAPLVRPAGSPTALADQDARLSAVVAFLARRHEVALAIDERPVVPRRAGSSIGSARLAREYATVARLARRLGIDVPAAPRAAGSPDAIAGQLRAWRAIARWLGARSEIRKPGERPLAARIPHHRELTCIAGHESKLRWDIATGNGYYGGLQMDRQFQQTYAPALYRAKGTADHWTAEEQMQAAERAIASRGFTPWPNTARMCGLL